MKKLIWIIIATFGLVSLPFGATSLAGHGGHGQKAATHAGKLGKHHGNNRQAKHASKNAAKHHKHKSSVSSQ